MAGAWEGIDSKVLLEKRLSNDLLFNLLFYVRVLFLFLFLFVYVFMFSLFLSLSLYIFHSVISLSLHISARFFNYLYTQ